MRSIPADVSLGAVHDDTGRLRWQLGIGESLDASASPLLLPFATASAALVERIIAITKACAVLGCRARDLPERTAAAAPWRRSRRTASRSAERPSATQATSRRRRLAIGPFPHSDTDRTNVVAAGVPRADRCADAGPVGRPGRVAAPPVGASAWRRGGGVARRRGAARRARAGRRARHAGGDRAVIRSERSRSPRLGLCGVARLCLVPGRHPRRGPRAGGRPRIGCGRWAGSTCRAARSCAERRPAERS